MSKLIRNNPIGIFDSGIGGLTVVKAVKDILPSEQIIYIGDTARLPYGSKTESIIKKYSLENSIFLVKREVKIIIIACNTASAISTDFIRSNFDIPVIGVVESGALAAVKNTINKKVGVIGTKATIKSKAYYKAIKKYDEKIEVFELATPILVSVVEEDWVDKKITQYILEEYLNPLFKKGIDTLVLGCTHFPFLAKRIKEIAPDITLVDSAYNTAILLQNELLNRSLNTTLQKSIGDEILLTDLHYDFQRRASRYLGVEVKLKEVDVENDHFNINN